MRFTKYPLRIFFILILLILLLTAFAPEERSLGANVRLVYLHGAWVLAAEVAFFAAALLGTHGLVARRKVFHDWSAAFGRTGILFWLTYLPLSLWTMQANWNGLFLAEPRFKLAAVFAVTGLLLQVGLWVIAKDWLISIANIIFFIVLRGVFSNTAYIMHPPPSPILNSGVWEVILYFMILNLLAWLAAYSLARWFVALARTA